MTLQNALKEIHFYRGVIPRDAYAYINENRHESIPCLLKILKDAIERHDKTGDYYVAHIHALLLLAQFREKKAYPSVIELMHLPIDSIDRLIGDMLTESMPQILTSIYDGNHAPIFELIENSTVDRCVRSIMGACLSSLIYQGLLDREVVILWLQEIVARGKMNGDSVFFTVLANITIDSKLEPLLDTVRAAFNAKLIDTSLVDSRFFEDSLSKSVEELIQKDQRSPIDAAANELKKWFSYNNDQPLAVKIDRNALCPCGSGQKFKKCCIQQL